MSALSTSSIGSPTPTTTATASSQPAASANGAALAVSGLISGINTDQVIQGLMAVEQQKITDIENKKTVINNQQAAFQQIETRLLTLQNNMTQLTVAQNGVFDARTAVSSNPTSVTAAGSSSATPGVYQLTVNNLAQANLVASQGFDASTSSLTHGTLQLTVGGATTTITVDSTDDTLAGLANAINNSGAGVNASVINDGGGDGKQAYRLLLAAQTPGTSNQINITNNLAASTAGATKPIFDTGAIGGPILASTDTSTAAIQTNVGAGYIGNANNSYKFTVVSGGTVGTDDVQVAYTDASGANTGTLTIHAGDANTMLNVAQGVQVQFGTGTLVAGDTFNVKTFVPTVQAAADASITLGSGSGALTVTSPTNQVDSLIPGVALNLLQANPTQPITITVANDTDSMTKAIQAFVSSYNDLTSYIDSQSTYDPNSQQAGILLGNSQAASIENQVRTAITNAVSGANPKLNYLGGLGVTTDSTGQLSVDTTKLGNVLSGQVPGVTINDVKALFALTGSSTNAGIAFLAGSTQTKASATPYTVNITQAAAQASLAASTPLGATTVLDNTNNAFTITLDGKTSDALTLAPGSYTPTTLAQALQAAINGDAALNGATVNVGVNGNSLAITSNRFGAASQVSFVSGSALTTLGFSPGTSVQGSDVAGYFTVNGQIETATGSGTFLSGDPGNANTANLQLGVTLTPAQVGAGIQASVSVSRGIASQLDQVLTNALDPANGRLQVITDGFNQSIQTLNDQETQQNAYIQARTQTLQAEFTNMEQVLSQLKAASGFVAAQSNSFVTQSSSSSSSSKS